MASPSLCKQLRFSSFTDDAGSIMAAKTYFLSFWTFKIPVLLIRRTVRNGAAHFGQSSDSGQVFCNCTAQVCGIWHELKLNLINWGKKSEKQLLILPALLCDFEWQHRIDRLRKGRMTIQQDGFTLVRKWDLSVSHNSRRTVESQESIEDQCPPFPDDHSKSSIGLKSV